MDSLTVARMTGTSLAMIERHYGHLLHDHAAKAMAGLAPYRLNSIIINTRIWPWTG